MPTFFPKRLYRKSFHGAEPPCFKKATPRLRGHWVLRGHWMGFVFARAGGEIASLKPCRSGQGGFLHSF